MKKRHRHLSQVNKINLEQFKELTNLNNSTLSITVFIYFYERGEKEHIRGKEKKAPKSEDIIFTQKIALYQVKRRRKCAKITE